MLYLLYVFGLTSIFEGETTFIKITKRKKEELKILTDF